MEGLNWDFVSFCQRAEVVAITLIVLASLQFFQLKIHNIHMYMYLQNSIRCNNDDIHMSFINTSRRLDLNCMCAFISLFKLLFVMCHQACKNGLVQHLEHLLFYGAQIDARTASGNTALHVAALSNQVLTSEVNFIN